MYKLVVITLALLIASAMSTPYGDRDNQQHGSSHGSSHGSHGSGHGSHGGQGVDPGFSHGGQGGHGSHGGHGVDPGFGHQPIQPVQPGHGQGHGAHQGGYQTHGY